MDTVQVILSVLAICGAIGGAAWKLAGRIDGLDKRMDGLDKRVDDIAAEVRNINDHLRQPRT